MPSPYWVVCRTEGLCDVIRQPPIPLDHNWCSGRTSKDISNRRKNQAKRTKGNQRRRIISSSSGPTEVDTSTITTEVSTGTTDLSTVTTDGSIATVDGSMVTVENSSVTPDCSTVALDDFTITTAKESPVASSSMSSASMISQVTSLSTTIHQNSFCTTTNTNTTKNISFSVSKTDKDSYSMCSHIDKKSEISHAIRNRVKEYLPSYSNVQSNTVSSDAILNSTEYLIATTSGNTFFDNESRTESISSISDAIVSIDKEHPLKRPMKDSDPSVYSTTRQCTSDKIPDQVEEESQNNIMYENILTNRNVNILTMLHTQFDQNEHNSPENMKQESRRNPSTEIYTELKILANQESLSSKHKSSVEKNITYSSCNNDFCKPISQRALDFRLAPCLGEPSSQQIGASSIHSQTDKYSQLSSPTRLNTKHNFSLTLASQAIDIDESRTEIQPKNHHLEKHSRLFSRGHLMVNQSRGSRDDQSRGSRDDQSRGSRDFSDDLQSEDCQYFISKV